MNSPWRGVLAFTGAIVILGVIVLAAIAGLRDQQQVAAPTASPPTGSPTTTPTATSTSTRASAPSAAPIASGTVSGALGYPSDFIPAQVVYALPTSDTSDGRYFVETELSRSSLNYTIKLPAGTYYFVAYTRESPPGTTYGGAYTRYVTCGMVPPCNDHSLIPVTVAAGQTVMGIDVRDWYDGGHYPPRPR